MIRYITGGESLMGTFGREAPTQRTSRVFGAKVVCEVGVLGGALEGDVDGLVHAERGPLHELEGVQLRLGELEHDGFAAGELNGDLVGATKNRLDVPGEV
jgi:hypothetical protein